MRKNIIKKRKFSTYFANVLDLERQKNRNVIEIRAIQKNICISASMTLLNAGIGSALVMGSDYPLMFGVGIFCEMASLGGIYGCLRMQQAVKYYKRENNWIDMQIKHFEN